VLSDVIPVPIFFGSAIGIAPSLLGRSNSRLDGIKGRIRLIRRRG
jgi:hypothetical protein